jgi:hypothetical protein
MKIASLSLGSSNLSLILVNDFFSLFSCTIDSRQNSKENLDYVHSKLECNKHCSVRQRTVQGKSIIF